MTCSSNIKEKLDTPVCSPQAAANYMLEKAKFEKRRLTPMQLIKLVYIAHGWTLALLNRPLFEDKVEAWQHGPVIPSLYHEFKHYGNGHIKEPALNLDIDDQIYYPKVNSSESSAIAVLDKVWDIYKGLSASQLRGLTHKADTPWRKCYVEGSRNVEIPKDEIRRHYVQLIENLANAERK